MFFRGITILKELFDTTSVFLIASLYPSIETTFKVVLSTSNKLPVYNFLFSSVPTANIVCLIIFLKSFCGISILFSTVTCGISGKSSALNVLSL